MPVDLPPLLRPLDRVREHITLHSGLSHRNATALGDGRVITLEARRAF